jgi:hypothetical protein
MRKLLQLTPLFLMIAGSFLFFERRAYAYADPGTGLLAIQAFGSALIATGWYLRRKIYALLHRPGTAKPVPESPAIGQDGSLLRP